MTPIQLWIVLMPGHRPYVTTNEPKEGYADTIANAGGSVYRAVVRLPIELDHGLIDSVDGEKA